MYLKTKSKLQSTWHDNMSSEEWDIYLCNMRILSMQKAQEEDRILICVFGISDSLIDINRLHKDMEKSAIEKYRRLTECQIT